MRFIEQSYPTLVPHYALRLFAGLRTSEARKMRWEWIDFEKRTILVPAGDDDFFRVAGFVVFYIDLKRGAFPRSPRREPAGCHSRGGDVCSVFD